MKPGSLVYLPATPAPTEGAPMPLMVGDCNLKLLPYNPMPTISLCFGAPRCAQYCTVHF